MFINFFWGVGFLGGIPMFINICVCSYLFMAPTREGKDRGGGRGYCGRMLNRRCVMQVEWVAYVMP